MRGAAPWGGWGAPPAEPEGSVPWGGRADPQVGCALHSSALPLLETRAARPGSAATLTRDFPPARERRQIAHGRIQPKATHPDTDNLCIQLAADNFPSLLFLPSPHPTASC